MAPLRNDKENGQVCYTVWDDMSACTEDDVARLLPMVSNQRREQALRFTHLFGRWSCLKTYEMLRQLLKDNSSLDTVSLPVFAYTDSGKPYLSGGPQFSISHCKKALMVAVSHHPVGVDIESLRRPSPALIERVMNRQEQTMIAQSVDPDRAFIRLWTAKEAVLKLRGTGLVDDMSDVLTGSEACYTKDRQDYVFTIAIQKGQANNTVK